MARQTKLLTANDVQALSCIAKEKDYVVGTYEGTLLLRVRLNANGEPLSTWLFVTRRNGKTYKQGLGRYSYHKKAGCRTLVEARGEARRIMGDLSAGLDPKAKPPQDDGAENELTVSEAFERFFEFCASDDNQRKWKNEKTLVDNQRFYRTLIAPMIGHMKMNEVRPRDIGAIVAPEMKRRLSTGSKVKSLLCKFFEWSLREEVGLRSSAIGNPARVTALQEYLPAEEQCKCVGNQPACDYRELPRFVRLLVEGGFLNSMRGMALLFTFLTASRIGNVFKNPDASVITYAEWKDFDFREGREQWLLSAEKMKKGKNGEHSVPLSKQAVAILRRIEQLGMRDGDAVFVSRLGTVVGEQSARDLIRRIAKKDAANGGSGFLEPKSGKLMTMHGAARACFATWALDQDDRDEVLIEKALHHKIITDGYNKAYSRSQQTEKRRPMMQAWADFLFSECPPDWDVIKA